jgi:hypothetical protein
VEQVQIIQEKEMISKLLKQFTIRTFIYSFLYFATIVILFILEGAINSSIGGVILVIVGNILYLMLISKMSTTDAFDGINTTSAPKKSLQRIANATAVPMFIFTCVVSFIDIIFFHSLFTLTSGYTKVVLAQLIGIVVGNIVICFLVVNIYEKRLLRKHVRFEEE